MFAINYNAAANSSKKTTAVISVKTITSNIGKENYRQKNICKRINSEMDRKKSKKK